MERVNKLLFHPEYQKHLSVIREAEKEREYCGHDLEHFMDVARLSWIYCLENKLFFERDIVYAMALMHDIGRSLEYTNGISHDKAGVQLCGEILGECGYSEEEIEMIQMAINNHRQSVQESDEREKMNLLGDILYYADHKSRKCFGCMAESTCYWPKEKKNLSIIR